MYFTGWNFKTVVHFYRGSVPWRKVSLGQNQQAVVLHLNSAAGKSVEVLDIRWDRQCQTQSMSKANHKICKSTDMQWICKVLAVVCLPLCSYWSELQGWISLPVEVTYCLPSTEGMQILNFGYRCKSTPWSGVWTPGAAVAVNNVFEVKWL